MGNECCIEIQLQKIVHPEHSNWVTDFHKTIWSLPWTQIQLSLSKASRDFAPGTPLGAYSAPQTPSSIFVPRVKYADSLAHRRLAAIETVERLKYHVF